ncbi:4-diphosphocytidyl-2-C-methyl-D-erythritol kinase [Actinomycetota bacterium]|nr:4-diphosphocytidyl-2-C-methyl-D-erythritol kinase [Actinomycetota bacterium]
MASIIAHAPAKLNLYLGVEPDLQDGKHLLNSVFCTVSLADTLIFDFISGPEPFNVQLDVKTPPPLRPFKIRSHNNTLLKTVELFKQSYGDGVLPSGTLKVQLIKSIPIQAGLGGGSSDAAAMLRMLAWLAQVDPLSAKSRQVASQVGADVPFFLYAPKQGCCALMGGAGDKLLEMLPQPALDIVLVKPSWGVSTKAAYGAFDASPQPVADEQLLINALKHGDKVVSQTQTQTHAHWYLANCRSLRG